MLSCSTCNRMFTLRNLKKCALVCTTRRSTAFNIASVASQFFPVLCRHCFGQHRYTSYVYIFERALRWRENATIYKEQMQTKCSDVINFYSIVDKRRGSQRVQRDDEEQMAYICRYFCVRPLNNFSDELG